MSSARRALPIRAPRAVFLSTNKVREPAVKPAVSSPAGPTLVKLVRTKRLYEQIAEAIIQLVRDNDMQPGDRIPAELSLARQLGVSRPAVREAMIALETAGLIDVRIGDGTYVRRIPAPDFRMPWARADDPGPGPRELYEAQEHLECMAAAMAAKSISPEAIDRLEALVDKMDHQLQNGEPPFETTMAFHIGLAQGCGNTVIAGYVRELWARRQEPMWNTMREHDAVPDDLWDGLEMRRRMIALLRARDGRGAQALLHRHFRRKRKVYFAG